MPYVRRYVRSRYSRARTRTRTVRPRRRMPYRGRRTRFPLSRRLIGGPRLATVSLKRSSDQVFAISEVNNAGTRSAVNTAVTSLAVNATQFAGWILGFRLEDIPNDSELAQMFRYARLNAVAITFSIKGIDAEPQDVGGYALPIMHYFQTNDDDETNMPQTLQQVRERGNCRKFYFGPRRRKTIVVRPHIRSSNQDINANPISGPARRMFIPTGNRTAVHTGLGVYFDCTAALSAASTTSFDIEATYYFTLKGTQ